MGSLIFKSHSINYAASPKSTHYDTRSYDIICVFIKSFQTSYGGWVGSLKVSLFCLPAYLHVLSVSKVLSNERGHSRCHLAGENRPIWLSRAYASPELFLPTRKYGVVV